MNDSLKRGAQMSYYRGSLRHGGRAGEGATSSPLQSWNASLILDFLKASLSGLEFSNSSARSLCDSADFRPRRDPADRLSRWLLAVTITWEGTPVGEISLLEGVIAAAEERRLFAKYADRLLGLN
jgi:hypothetical protein